MPVDAIVRLAEHVDRTSFASLPATAVAAVKTFVLDSIGVAIAGSGEDAAARLVGAAEAWGRGNEATVWGRRRRLPAPSAALVNAFNTHCLEFDCVHEGAVVHPMATLLAALCVAAEQRGAVTGRELVTAVAVGVDVAATIGVAARGPMRFFRPATAGAFGATAALGKLAGLDVDTLVSAFGLVYGQVSGTLQAHVEGLPALGLQIGVNARAAVTAVDLARRGFAGPREVLEGRYGYFRLFEGDAYDVTPALAELGRVWRVAELSHKPFPTGRLTHGVVDALLRLRGAHGFTAADVERVTARVPPLVVRLVGRSLVPAPSASYARLCLPLVAAIALLRGGVDVPDFRADGLADVAAHALAPRIDVVADANPDENAMVPQQVEVTLRDGSRHGLAVSAVLGSPDRPLTPEQHLAKFRRNWTYGAHPLDVERGERLIELVDGLDAVADVRALFLLTVPR
jgi:2-methylcitrate dehydratase PrpD